MGGEEGKAEGLFYSTYTPNLHGCVSDAEGIDEDQAGLDYSQQCIPRLRTASVYDDHAWATLVPCLLFQAYV